MAEPKKTKGKLDPIAIHSREALVRYMVVSRVRAQLALGKDIEAALAETLEKGVEGPDGQRVSATLRTVREWIKKFEQGGTAALERRTRKPGLISEALPPELVTFLRAEKERDRYASVPELIRRARLLALVPDDTKLDRTSVWRAVRRLGLPTRRVPSKREGDTRPFEYGHRMMMVIADGKRFRAGVGRKKRLAFFFLDDATRYGLDVVVGAGWGEPTELFLTGVHGVIERYGFFDSIYVDNSSGAISLDSAAVMSRLRCNLILGTAGYPQGHGKAERFNQTAIAQALRGLAGNASVEDAPAALRLRLRHWLWNGYNQQPHESLPEVA
jgi:transposase InsO family protein